MTIDFHVDNLVAGSINGEPPLTDPATTAGDLLVYDGSALQRLPVGTSGQQLVADSTQTLKMKWAAGLTNPMTTAGDMIVGGAAGVPTRLPKGTDTYVLTMVGGAQAWVAPSSVSPPAYNPQTGTSYTLQLTDAPAASGNQGIVSMNNASANTLTVPPNSAVPFPTGTIIQVPQLGAGQTAIAAGSGVTVETASSLTARVQFSTLVLTCLGSDLWILSGDCT